MSRAANSEQHGVEWSSPIRQDRKWRRVDNVGKIFLATRSVSDQYVFRCSCELHERVSEDLLQRALEHTAARFPHYQVVIRKGVFWYYFESNGRDGKPRVTTAGPDEKITIDPGDPGSALYRLSCHDRRIDLDIFHGLTDGSGAILFLRLIVAAYLSVVHTDKPEMSAAMERLFDSLPVFEPDCFGKNAAGAKGSYIQAGQRAFAFGHQANPDAGIRLFRGILSTSALLAESRAHGVSITVLLTALYIQAIHTAMTPEDEKSPVVIAVPVDLRKQFGADTYGNFIAMIHISYDFSVASGDLSSMVSAAQAAFDEQLRPESLQRQFSQYVTVERNAAIRAVPLALKNYAMQFRKWMSDRQVTSTLSNLGRVDMPAGMTPYIRFFDFYDRTDSIKICTVSFEDSFCISLTSAMSDTAVPQAFFRSLADMGLRVELMTN